MADPLISVITAVRNDPEGLRRTLASIATELPLAQHLIVDGSDVPLLALAPRPQVQILVGRDRGIAHAFNRGILAAQGRYILFVNAGDCVRSGAGSLIERALGESADCVWFAVTRIHENGRESLYRPRVELLRYAMAAPHQGMILRREVFAEIGLFPLQRYAMDHHLALRLMMRQPRYKLTLSDTPIATYPAGGHSSQGGVRPFIANCYNTLRLAPQYFPVGVVANVYLALKSALSRRAS